MLTLTIINHKANKKTEKLETYRVRFNDSWLVFHNSSWSFHEPYFSRKEIFHKLYRKNRIQDYGLKTGKQVQICSTVR